ncbi:hypothetical protein TorRG33x02_331850 [Trema orientale]|uniref:Uncharacterized protein n=1 Tax=Trema orientale TaxID=63057 RepID=A0A2P5B5N6_TREOI|nr:hypothetical protein TorRG33x02_331850 [Trema orientale]
MVWQQKELGFPSMSGSITGRRAWPFHLLLLTRPFKVNLTPNRAYDSVRSFPTGFGFDPVVNDFKTLTAWIGTIAFVLFCGNGGTGSIEIWVVTCCSGGVSDPPFWIKYLSIGPLEGIQGTLTFWKSDELLLEGIDEWFASYNLRNGKITKVRKVTIPRVDSMLYWGLYVKSFPSIGKDRLDFCLLAIVWSYKRATGGRRSN